MLERKQRFDFKDYKQNDKKSEKSNSFMSLYIVFVIFIGLLLALHISHTVKITHLSYKVEELEGQLKNLKSENHQLQLKTAKKLSLKNIESIARNELGMEEPDKIRYISLNTHNKINDESNNLKNKNTLRAIYDFFEKIKTVNASSPE